MDGTLVHSSFVPGPEYSFWDKGWYQDGLKSPEFVFGDVYLDENTNSYVVGASSLLKDRNGNPRGVASADIYLDAICDCGGKCCCQRGIIGAGPCYERTGWTVPSERVEIEDKYLINGFPYGSILPGKAIFFFQGRGLLLGADLVIV